MFSDLFARKGYKNDGVYDWTPNDGEKKDLETGFHLFLIFIHVKLLLATAMEIQKQKHTLHNLLNLLQFLIQQKLKLLGIFFFIMFCLYKSFEYG